MVTDKMNNAWGEAQELGAQASANAQHMYQEATAKGQAVSYTHLDVYKRQRYVNACRVYYVRSIPAHPK